MPERKIVPPAWAALLEAVGGRVAFAHRLRIDEATVWRWVHGKTRPGEATRTLLNKWCDRYEIAHVFESAIPIAPKEGTNA